MLTEKDKKSLKAVVDTIGKPEENFSLNELTGFLFGIAMTPEPLLPSQWLPIVFGSEPGSNLVSGKLSETVKTLTAVYNRLVASFHDNTLTFPFAMANLTQTELETLYEWVSGFDEALLLREEIWDPQTFPQMEKSKKQELFHSMMTIQGLADPSEVEDYFHDLPEQVLRMAFPDMDLYNDDQQFQLQMFLLSALPLAVQTLLEHARYVERYNEDIKSKALATKSPAKKNNIIRVDFSRTSK